MKMEMEGTGLRATRGNLVLQSKATNNRRKRRISCVGHVMLTQFEFQNTLPMRICETDHSLGILYL